MPSLSWIMFLATTSKQSIKSGHGKKVKQQKLLTLPKNRKLEYQIDKPLYKGVNMLQLYVNTVRFMQETRSDEEIYK